MLNLQVGTLPCYASVIFFLGVYMQPGEEYRPRSTMSALQM